MTVPAKQRGSAKEDTGVHVALTSEERAEIAQPFDVVDLMTINACILSRLRASWRRGHTRAARRYRVLLLKVNHQAEAILALGHREKERP